MGSYDPFMTIQQASALLSSRSVSAVGLVDLYLERIRFLDPQLNSFIRLTAQAAQKQAQAADEEIKRDGPRSTLHGIPLVLKDLFDLQGLPTTGGALFFNDVIAVQDATAVAALRKAGAVFLGKTNMHEIALGLTNVNPHYGACRNPWDPSRVSGGSSGGSAVAVAAGLCQGALGSDTGGSIRVPAALCGIVGFKPTYGRVSLRGVLPLSWNLDHAGSLARSVSDAALLYQAIAGYDAGDPFSANQPLETLQQLESGVKNWRVAVASGEYLTQVTDPVIQDAVQQATGVFAQLGARVAHIEIPWLREAALANGMIVQSDAATFHRERIQNAPEKFGADVRKRLEMGAATNILEYIQARRTQVELTRRLERFFDEFDVLILPMTAVAAPPIEGPDALEQARLLTRFSAPFNLTGAPAISLPCGFTTSGLPIGLQIVASRWQEVPLLRAAYAYEQATEWHLRKPPLCS